MPQNVQRALLNVQVLVLPNVQRLVPQNAQLLVSKNAYLHVHQKLVVVKVLNILMIVVV